MTSRRITPVERTRRAGTRPKGKVTPKAPLAQYSLLAGQRTWSRGLRPAPRPYTLESHCTGRRFAGHGPLLLCLKGTGLSLKGMGFTGCEKTYRKGQEVSGHDFSRAADTAKSTWALAPARMLFVHFARKMSFSLSLFRNCGIKKNHWFRG